jgi:hypothetical protein
MGLPSTHLTSTKNEWRAEEIHLLNEELHSPYKQLGWRQARKALSLSASGWEGDL